MLYLSDDGNFGSKQRPVVSWMLYNVEGPSMTNGQQGIPYLQPFSPGHYLYMALEQENDISSMAMYGEACPGNLDSERR